MFLNKPALFFCIWIAWLGITLPGRGDNLERSVSGDNVTVTLTSPFSTLPPGGAIPFLVTIRNDEHSPGTWHMVFRSGPSFYGSGRNDSTFEENLTVAANSSSSFELVVPMPSTSISRNNFTSLWAGITGPGLDNSNLNKEYFATFSTDYNSGKSPFTLIGENVLGPIGLGPLENWYKDRSQEFYGSEVSVAHLPSDWRAYSGVACLMLKDTEWLELSRPQHEAICDYVVQGGRLTLFTTENVDTRTPELGLPTLNGKAGPYGFGIIAVTPVSVLPPDATTLKDTIQKIHARSLSETDQEFSTWNLRKALGTIAVSGLFIFSFVFVFGSLVGPINLFVFARGKHRFRLFWTTPLISILASLFLVAAILLTDGVGGSGRQTIAIYSLPGSNQEAVIQEQAARTAVLFSSHWINRQNYLITPISSLAMDNAMESDGSMGSRTVSSSADDSANSYIQKGNELSGHWFRTRSISGQYLQAMLPSRSSVTVLNTSAFMDQGAAPVLLSSFSEELTEVHLLDKNGNFWTCNHLAPGQKKTCTPCTQSDHDRFWDQACSEAGGKLRPTLNAAAKQVGCFYATGTPSSSEILSTLGEIRWHVASCVYLGPWVASPTAETTP